MTTNFSQQASGATQSSTTGTTTPGADGATPDTAIETALRSLIDRYGPSLLSESGRLRSFLQDECPNSKREISVLLQALDEQVPQDLLRVQSGEPLESLAPRLAKRLTDQKALAPEASNWAVKTWARGLGVSAVATDALPASLFGDVSLSSAAANDWMEISSPSRSNTNSAPYNGGFQSGNVQPPLGVPGETTGGFFAKPANRWLAAAAAVIAAVAIWFGFFATKPLEITRVDTADAFVGDGKKRDVQVSFKPGSNVQSVQVRFVRGDGKWDPQPMTINVTPDASAQGRATAGQIGVRTVRSSTATFEYTLVAADGKRSAPFEKTFEIAAGPAQPPVIGSVNMPKSITVGKPFTFTIAYENGAGAVASVERKVIDSNVKWESDEMTTKVTDLTSNKNGTLNYPFLAMNTPVKSTIEFTLVDADGVRSEPVRVALEVAPPAPVTIARPSVEYGCTSYTCGRVVYVRPVQQSGVPQGTGVVAGSVLGGLLGNQIGQGRGRTAATIAGAIAGGFAGNAVQSRTATTRYEVTVQLDGGGSRTVLQNYPFQNGQRVRINGDSVSALR